MMSIPIRASRICIAISLAKIMLYSAQTTAEHPSPTKPRDSYQLKTWTISSADPANSGVGAVHRGTLGQSSPVG